MSEERVSQLEAALHDVLLRIKGRASLGYVELLAMQAAVHAALVTESPKGRFFTYEEMHALGIFEPEDFEMMEEAIRNLPAPTPKLVEIMRSERQAHPLREVTISGPPRLESVPPVQPGSVSVGVAQESPPAHPQLIDPQRTKLTFGKSVYAYMRNLLEVMEREGHITAWSVGDGNTDGVPFRHFLFLTFSQERAQKVEAVLQDKGLLCDTDLGGYAVNDDGEVKRVTDADCTCHDDDCDCGCLQKCPARILKSHERG